ncbi:creatininase family protein [Paenibacillus thiaminolyticus]|uniref:Creatininase family protein n=1 Tax=Paenibacillus thiaminolyticus TaxID=49283 RepID=A0AAP9DW74_PANTH|nr:creatininase family protein [Paenibacillus thiaminolyticus]MCY9535465.1 creatininase family protein [Paenibacillus thiaminolyticus]MCY9602184.1 creatininase family protein [Paenibacillus thiaminolyticus]MCY9605956.1 creatininase family protein [Paenibacillus thiaminolyticus]MCY9612363.1 creatininase family protein [Paenibacillus thiaminolyticus]MCY9621152.1 creatininase family protein [Paenibacillus thiaminolyticus]
MKAIGVHGRDIEQVTKEARFAVVPLGSVEYHGPHAPLGTDTILAEGFAERIDPSLHPLIFPAVPFSACPGKTRHYPGTIPVRPTVFIDYLTDVVEGICRLGIRHIVLLNAHDANMGPARTVAEQVTGTYPEVSFLLINWWQMASVEFTQRMGLFQGTAGRGHGGPYEMSVVKAFFPEMVTVQKSDLEFDASSLLSPVPYVLVEGTPQGWDGYTGRIRQCSLEAGQIIVEEASRNMNLLIQEWLARRTDKKKE